MNDHAGRKFACGREMGNNEFVALSPVQPANTMKHTTKNVQAFQDSL